MNIFLFYKKFFKKVLQKQIKASIIYMKGGRNMTGEEIKRLRTQAGLTQQQLADKVGVTQSTVWTWEANKKRASVRHIELIKVLCKTTKHLEIAEKLKADTKDKDTYAKGYANGYYDAVTNLMVDYHNG